MRRLLVGAALAATVAAEGAPAEKIFELANRHLDELSGLALSRADPSVLWGHNDTGAGPVLYRIGPRGEDLGRVLLPDAGATDWEDIAAFEDAGGPALLVGDVGDNFAIRSFVTLYAVRDAGRGEPHLLWRLDFEYPDGPRDCEAIGVDPVSRSILLVSKRDVPQRLYRLALPEQPPKTRQVAEFLGEIGPLPVPTLGEKIRVPLSVNYAHAPTALDVSRDGATAVLVTQRHAYVYRRDRNTSWAQAFRVPAAVIPLPRLGQIEAAALSADSRELVIGSEGQPGRPDRPGRLARAALP